MTTAQYLAALKQLGLTSHGKATVEALGVTVRQLDNYANGHTPIPPMLEKLLSALISQIPSDHR